jgi:4'-phosphopantetheinyl transferase
VSATIVQVADGVWVAAEHRPAPSTTPADLAFTGLPAWRRRERLAARGLLRALLARMAPEAADAPLVASAGGQPALAGFPEIGVSLSHDGEVAAAAVAVGRAVGVDVQLPPVPLSERMVRRCLRDRAADLHALPAAERAVELAWVWSVQEACVKAEGTGLAGRPWAIDVPIRAQAGRARALRWVALRGHSEVPVSCAFGGVPWTRRRPPG